jgi:hypothetical protein
MKYEIIHHSANNRTIKGACVACHRETMTDIEIVIQQGLLCSNCIGTFIRVKSWYLP